MNSSIKRILPIALGAALLGGTVGAFVMRAPKPAETADTMSNATPVEGTITPATDQALPINYDNSTATVPEQAAYRDGFEEGYVAGQGNRSSAVNYRTALRSRVPYASTRSRGVSNGYSESRSYSNNSTYTQPQPRRRSFWQKHRDKLTVAAGAGGGALIGSLIGGKKGALIGGLAGGGGSALYTYKIRKRTPQY
jgi:hypothetical protein